MSEFNYLYNTTNGNFDEIEVDVLNIAQTLRVDNIISFSGNNITIANDVDFSGTIQAFNYNGLINSLDLSGLIQNEINQIGNINNIAISSTQWQYLGQLNQNLTTSSAVNFAGISSNTIAANSFYCNQISPLIGSSVSFDDFDIDNINNITAANLDLSGVLRSNSINTISGNFIVFNNKDLANVGLINGLDTNHILYNTNGSTSVANRLPFFDNTTNGMTIDNNLYFNSSNLYSPNFVASNQIIGNQIVPLTGNIIGFDGNNLSNFDTAHGQTLIIENIQEALNGFGIDFNNDNLNNVGLINGFSLNNFVGSKNSSIDNSLAIMDGTTGKLIKHSNFWALNSDGDLISPSKNLETGGDITANFITAVNNIEANNDLIADNNGVIKNTLQVNNIIESFNNNGVTLEGILLKDSRITQIDYLNFGQTNLNYYYEYNASFSLSFVIGSSSSNCKFIRIGKQVTMHCDGWTFTGNNNNSARMTSIPNDLDSPVDSYYTLRIVEGSTSRIGFCIVRNNNTIDFYSDSVTGGGTWGFGSACQIYRFCISWLLL